MIPKLTYKRRRSKALTPTGTNTQEYVEVSTTYGRIKYEIVQQAWTVLFYAKEGEAVRQQRALDLIIALLWARRSSAIAKTAVRNEATHKAEEFLIQ